jgi:hypothetical protein
VDYRDVGRGPHQTQAEFNEMRRVLRQKYPYPRQVADFCEYSEHASLQSASFIDDQRIKLYYESQIKDRLRDHPVDYESVSIALRDEETEQAGQVILAEAARPSMRKKNQAKTRKPFWTENRELTRYVVNVKSGGVC